MIHPTRVCCDRCSSRSRCACVRLPETATNKAFDTALSFRRSDVTALFSAPPLPLSVVQQGSFIHRLGCAVSNRLAYECTSRPKKRRTHLPIKTDDLVVSCTPNAYPRQLHSPALKAPVPSGPFITEKETKKYRKQQEKPVRRRSRQLFVSPCR